MMMKKDRKTLLITTLVCVCTLFVYIAFYKFFPLVDTPVLDYRIDFILLTGIAFNIILNIRFVKRWERNFWLD